MPLSARVSIALGGGVLAVLVAFDWVVITRTIASFPTAESNRSISALFSWGFAVLALTFTGYAALALVAFIRGRFARLNLAKVFIAMQVGGGGLLASYVGGRHSWDDWAIPGTVLAAGLAGSLFVHQAGRHGWPPTRSPEAQVLAGLHFAAPFDGSQADGSPYVSDERGWIDDDTERQRVIAYLDAGELLMFASGRAPDVFDPQAAERVPTAVRTDGQWCWWDATRYYLSVHRIAPHPRLYQRIRDNGYVCPPVSKDQISDGLVALWQFQENTL